MCWHVRDLQGPAGRPRTSTDACAAAAQPTENPAGVHVNFLQQIVSIGTIAIKMGDFDDLELPLQESPLPDIWLPYMDPAGHGIWWHCESLDLTMFLGTGHPADDAVFQIPSARFASGRTLLIGLTSTLYTLPWLPHWASRTTSPTRSSVGSSPSSDFIPGHVRPAQRGARGGQPRCSEERGKRTTSTNQNRRFF